MIAFATGAVLVATYLITRMADIPYRDLTRDPAATLGGPWYTGVLSTGSIVLLLVGSGIALFAASFLRESDNRSMKGLLTATALLMIVVGLDDLFMLHETIHLEFGITSAVYLAIYGFTLVAILWMWREVIVGSTDYVFIVLAGVGMGLSIVVDVIMEQRLFQLPFSGDLIEDPAKIVGMAFMTYYMIVTSHHALTRQSDPVPG
jgi:hypothetical protein